MKSPDRRTPLGSAIYARTSSLGGMFSFVGRAIMLLIGAGRCLALSGRRWDMHEMTGGTTKRILVVGVRSPLIEGVRDLLQLAGYQVALSSGWAEAQRAVSTDPPSLALVDLSIPAQDVSFLDHALPDGPGLDGVPILFVSLNGGDSIVDLRRRIRGKGNGRFRFYSPRLLGVDGLLEQVESCLASPGIQHERWGTGIARRLHPC